MDILFENHYIRDKACIQELMFHSTFRSPIVIISYFVSALLLINMARAWIFFHAFLYHYLIFIMVFYPVLYIQYLRSVNLVLKRDQEVTQGQPMELWMRATATGVTMEAIAQNPEIPFPSFKKAMLTKNYILLFSNARLIYAFRKDSFTKGTAQEFIQFLKNQGIKVK